MDNDKLLQEIEDLKRKVSEMDGIKQEIAELKKSRIKNIFNSIPRNGLVGIIAVSIISISAIIYAATVTNLTTFTAGTTIVAEDVNANFAIVAPVGSITMYGAATAPTGWLLCNGNAISRADYAALFTKIGTTFGAGDGSATFSLPDFRGVFPKGAGQQGTASWAGANYAGTLGTYTQDTMQGHWHNAKLGHEDAGGSTYLESSDVVYTESGGQVTNPISDGTNGNPRTGKTTEPQSLGVSFIIKY